MITAEKQNATPGIVTDSCGERNKYSTSCGSEIHKI